MNGLIFGENEKVLLGLEPKDIVATATGSEYIAVKHSNWLTALVLFGAMTSDSTDLITITVEASTEGASNATEAAIPFKYRKFAAKATDNLGDITAATSAGVTIAANEDNKAFVIDIDPAALPTDSSLTDPKYVRVVLTPGAEVASCLTAIVWFSRDKYPGNDIPSAT